MEQTEGARLVVRRTTSDWHGRKTTYVLFVYDVPESGLDQGETVERTLPSGRHVLQIRFSWFRSKKIIVDAEPGDVIRVVCDPLNNLVLLVYPPAYFQFRLEDESA